MAITAKQLSDYSNKNITKSLIDEISSALKSIDAYGSVELYIQNSHVTQITTRNIIKTDTFNNKK